MSLLGDLVSPHNHEKHIRLISSQSIKYTDEELDLTPPSPLLFMKRDGSDAENKFQCTPCIDDLSVSNGLGEGKWITLLSAELLN